MNEYKTTRRTFLKATGLAAAAMGFPTIIPSSARGDATTPPQGALPPPSAVPGVGGPPESLGEMPPMTGGM